jgi:hypothetical protein
MFELYKKCKDLFVLININYYSIVVINMYNLYSFFLPEGLDLKVKGCIGFGIIVPVFLDSLTFVPSSRYLLLTLVGSLKYY